jgi:catechol 2,3-dioxygenase-like lactoylglutathione lyase family enzyme
MTSIVSLLHASLLVADLARARGFYEGVLGLAVGALPDMVTFTPDGSRLLVANEATPADLRRAHRDVRAARLRQCRQRSGRQRLDHRHGAAAP